jgi:hypothetical protein
LGAVATEKKQPTEKPSRLDVLSKLVLPLAALGASVAAIFVAVEAKNISDRQADIAARQLQPVITASLSYGFAAGFARDQTLTVSNVGGPALGVQVADATLIQAQYVQGLQTGSATLPVEHYYTAIQLTDQPTGVLALAEGPGNNAAETALERGAARLGARGRGALDIRLHQYVRVSYTDDLGMSHVVYLEVDPDFGNSPISASVGAAAFKKQAQADAGFGNFVDLYTTTPQRLRALVESR